MLNAHPKTIYPTCPEIRQQFNPDLLLTTLQRYLRNVRNKIIPRAAKKLKNCSGRQREFDKLKKEFHEVYERKTIEEANYKAKMQKKAEERPCIPISGGTMRFKRIYT